MVSRGRGVPNSVVMGANKGRNSDQGLLPGISDHVVLDKVVSKLRWKDFYILSSVSRAWNTAIRSGQVFDLRGHFHESSETLVGCHLKNNTIVLFSMKENAWYTLPPIGADMFQGRSGVLKFARCISMERKIYILGGEMRCKVDNVEVVEFSNKVFMFDFDEGGNWKACARMKQGRRALGTAVKDGKIYMFGGTGENSILNSEVYEPKENTWSCIGATTTGLFGHSFAGWSDCLVIQIGEALCIHDNWCQHSFYDESFEGFPSYLPSKDEWQVVRSWYAPAFGIIFSVHGIVFEIYADYPARYPDALEDNLAHDKDFLAIDKYDVNENSWIRVHLFSFDSLVPVEYDLERLWSAKIRDDILVVDDELIALMRYRERRGENRLALFVFKSTGLGSQKISWKLRAITFEHVLETPEHYFVQTL